MNLSTSCTILVTYGIETPEFTILTITPFAVIQQKYHAKYLRMSQTYLTYFTGLVGILVGMIIPIFVWQTPKGRCYVNQLNLADVCRHCQERPLLFASAFDNGLAARKSAFKRLNANNPAISYKFGRLSYNNVGVYAVKTHNFYHDLLEILHHTSFICHLCVPKWIGISQF